MGRERPAGCWPSTPWRAKAWLAEEREAAGAGGGGVSAQLLLGGPEALRSDWGCSNLLKLRKKDATSACVEDKTLLPAGIWADCVSLSELVSAQVLSQGGHIF